MRRARARPLIGVGNPSDRTAPAHMARRQGEVNLDWERALCGVRPSSGWTTEVEGRRWCITCLQRHDAEQIPVQPPPQARYMLVAEALRRHAGGAAVGAQMPTMQEAMDRYEVSSDTVRRAWNVLRREGWIETRGNRTYVAR